MIPRIDPPAALLRLAALQSDVLTAEQVRGHDVGRRTVERMIAQGHWQRLSTGLYLTRPGDPGWESQTWAGVLLGGDAARLGGRAAGHTWRLCDEPDEILVLVPPTSGSVSRQRWRFAREQPGLRLPSRRCPPITAVEDTVLDLGRDADERQMIDVVSTAVQKGLTTPPRLRRRLAARGRVPHRLLIELLLDEVADGAETPLEIAFLRDVERAHDLPRGVRQVRIGTDVRDVLYEEYGVVVELDGHLGHEGQGRFRDMRRDNRTTVRGEATLRYGWYDVRQRGCEAAWQLGGVLGNRGWSGVPQRCSRCRLAPLGDLTGL